MISYDDLAETNYDIIINTTPVGMYPNVDNSPISEDLVKNQKL